MMKHVFQPPAGSKALKIEPVDLNETKLVDEAFFVDFNRVVQQTFEEERECLNKMKAIIRCDNLPHIQACETDLKRLSDTLVQLILHHPPEQSKLFIYIKCNQPEVHTLLDPATSKLATYEICFHTNSCNEASWQATHEPEIAACTAICAQYSGMFTAAYGHANSLFKFTLPGKFN